MVHMDLAAVCGYANNIGIKNVSTSNYPLLSRNTAKPSSFRQRYHLNWKQKEKPLHSFKTPMNQIDADENYRVIAIQTAYASDGMSGQAKGGCHVLTLAEIRLLADALRGVGSMIERWPDYLDRLCADQCASVGDSTMARTVVAAIMDDQLDTKWDVEGKDLLRKISQLSWESRRTIVFGIVEFWERSADVDEESLHWILDEVNTAMIKAKTMSTSLDPRLQGV
jgi:hypothetical protein